MGIYNGQTCGLKTKVYICTSKYVVPVEYGTFSLIFHLVVYFFKYITGISSRGDYVLWCIFALLLCIGIWNNLSIYIVTPDRIKWS